MSLTIREKQRIADAARLWLRNRTPLEISRRMHKEWLSISMEMLTAYGLQGCLEGAGYAHRAQRGASVAPPERRMDCELTVLLNWMRWQS